MGAGEKDNSFLLRGKDLRDAEVQLATNTSKNPYPTDLHREYILKSRQVADRQRRWLTVLSIAAAVVMFALGVYGLSRSEKGQTKMNSARSLQRIMRRPRNLNSKINQLSALAVTKIDQNFNEALLLGVEAYRHTKENLTNNFTAQGAITKILQSNPGLIQVLLGHTDWVNTVAISPDGNLLASGSWDATAILWDISNPAFPVKLETLTDHTAAVESVTFSSDGKTLATASTNELILWDISDPSNPKLLGRTNGYYLDLKFIQTDKILSTIEFDENYVGTAVLLQVTDRKSLTELSKFDSGEENVSMVNIAVSSDRNLLFSSLNNGNILEWDITDPGNPVLLFTMEGSAEYIYSLAISADGRTLASGNTDTTIALWDITDPAAPSILSIWSGHSLAINSLAFSADGNTLASSSDDNKAPIILWDISNRNVAKKIRTLNGHSLTVTSLLFSQNKDILISASRDSTIMLWNVTDPKTELELGSIEFPANESVNSMAFKPNSTLLTMGNSDGKLAIWDVADPADPAKIKTLSGPINITVFSRDGNLMATSDYGNTVTLWNAADFAKLGTIKIDNDSVNAIELSTDGKTLAVIGDKIVFWNITDPKKPAKLTTLPQQTGEMSDMVFNSDGKFMAAIADKTIILWDVSNPASPTRLSVLEGHSNTISSIAFSPTDPNLLASASWDKTVILWNISDPRNPQMVNTLSNHSDWINTIAFSPDGTMLASGSDDKRVNLWNISNPEAPALISKMIGHTDSVGAVAFSPPGGLIASFGYENRIIFWDINPESWAQKACFISGGDFTILEWNQFFPSEQYRQTCEPFHADEGLVVPATGGEPPIIPPTVGQASTPFPVCTSDQIPGCTLPASKKLDEFCTDNNSYGLYNLPINTTFEVLTPGFTCIYEKSNSLGEPRISCTGPTNKEFEVSFCNSTCSNTLETSYDCEAGFGLNSAQGCCAPISSTSNGCVTETLTLLGCK